MRSPFVEPSVLPPPTAAAAAVASGTQCDFALRANEDEEDALTSEWVSSSPAEPGTSSDSDQDIVKDGAASPAGFSDSSFFFEGPEKRLEISLLPLPGNAKGLLAVPDDAWSKMLQAARCTIIRRQSVTFGDSEVMRSYVLSESSLFVSPYRVMVKTCGTTTLLYCLPAFFQEILPTYLPEASLRQLLFSRKSLARPERQSAVHVSFDRERAYLELFFASWAGKVAATVHHPFVLGPLNGDHWVICLVECASLCLEHAVGQPAVVEVVMHDLDKDSMRLFQQPATAVEKQFASEQMMRLHRGSTAEQMEIAAPAMDEVFFDPCGYSMNAVSHGPEGAGSSLWYSTVHVTPEPGFSFVSFETSLPEAFHPPQPQLLQQQQQQVSMKAEECETGAAWLRRLLGFFRPGRFSVLFHSPRCPALVHPQAARMAAAKAVAVVDGLAAVGYENTVLQQLTMSSGSMLLDFQMMHFTATALAE